MPYIYVAEPETQLHICDRFSGIRRFHGHEFEGDQRHSITASSIHTPSSTSYDEYASFVLVSSRLLYREDVLYLSRAPIAGSYVDYISHNYTSCPSPINHTPNTALHSPPTPPCIHPATIVEVVAGEVSVTVAGGGPPPPPGGVSVLGPFCASAFARKVSNFFSAVGFSAKILFTQTCYYL